MPEISSRRHLQIWPLSELTFIHDDRIFIFRSFKMYHTAEAKIFGFNTGLDTSENVHAGKKQVLVSVSDCTVKTN